MPTAPAAARPDKRVARGRLAHLAHVAARYPATTAMLATGLLLRAILLPITHGQDFVVWDLASRYTLAGVNVFAHHPPYPGGPYAYFPLFLYLELPLQWLALHSGLPFTVLGKLPIIAGDVITTGLLALYFYRRGYGDRMMALAGGLYALNPLVLYNGALYGRFDALCGALFLLALHAHDTGRPRVRSFPLLFGAAVATKLYPVFTLPWVLVNEPARRWRTLTGIVAVLVVVSLPYLVTSPLRFVADLLYTTIRLPGNLSWQVALLGVLPDEGARLFGDALMVFFAGALFLFTRLDYVTYCTVALLLFLVISKIVIEQYFVWPLPFLIVAALDRRSRASWALLILLSIAGMLVNPFVHPFGQRIVWVNVAIAASALLYVATRRPYPATTRPTW